MYQCICQNSAIIPALYNEIINYIFTHLKRGIKSALYAVRYGEDMYVYEFNSRLFV